MSEFDGYRVLGCALVLASILIVVAFFARAVKEMTEVLR